MLYSPIYEANPVPAHTELDVFIENALREVPPTAEGVTVQEFTLYAVADATLDFLDTTTGELLTVSPQGWAH